MTVKGGSRPACAACRFQRCRCSLDCPLAPYFPATHPKTFQNVHSLYGVGHIMKILNLCKNDDQKEEAMKSIIYESNIRQLHRVHGCYGVIVELHQRLTQSIQELQYLRMLLDSKLKNSEVPVNEQGVGGSSDWISSMINGVSDLGFYQNVSGNDWDGKDWDDDDDDDDDRAETEIKTTVNDVPVPVPPKRSSIDEVQQFFSIEQDDQGSQDYTGIGCGPFVDHDHIHDHDQDHDQEFLWASKEVSALNLESSMKDLSEAEETKPNGKVVSGVDSLKTGRDL